MNVYVTLCLSKLHNLNLYESLLRMKRIKESCKKLLTLTKISNFVEMFLLKLENGLWAWSDAIKLGD